MSTDPHRERAALVTQAQTSYSSYPQMTHKWDDWLLGRMTRRVWRYGRLYVDKDEVVLVDPQATDDALRRVFAARVGVEIEVAVTHVELIA